jgi:predicted ATP-binding protein involved in virulence
MYIEKIAIKNFKAIENIEIDFRPGFNLLIGDNGVGKSSVLEAITVALGGYLSGVTGVSSKNILQEEVRFCLNRLGQASSGIEYKTPVEIGCKLVADGKTYDWSRRRKDEQTSSKTTTDNREIGKYAQEITNDLSKTLPLLCFQSEARVWQTKRGDFGTILKKKLNDRRCGYIGCLDYSLDIKGIREWCLKMELAAFQQCNKIKEYEAFKDLVGSFMRNIGDLHKKPIIYYSQQIGDIVYRDSEQEMPISNLSAGYQSLLWITMNLAYRLALLNPEAGDTMGQTPGIVLIDELDMHLHPKWQGNVVKALEETFPRMQFIVATHSPMIISSCKNEHLILMRENQEIVYLPDAYGYSVKDVLELRQESTEKPKEITMFCDQFERALDRNDHTEAEKIVNRMSAALGDNHKEVRKAKEELELSYWVEAN